MRVCIKSHVFILYVYAHLNVYDAFVSARVCVHVYDYAYANAKKYATMYKDICIVCHIFRQSIGIIGG